MAAPPARGKLESPHTVMTTYFITEIDRNTESTTTRISQDKW